MKGYHYETLENHRCPPRGRPAGRRLQLQLRHQQQRRQQHRPAASTVTISNENGQLWTCGFNPYNGSTTLLSVGFVYEPLVFVNPLQNGKTTPMLATAWKWGAGNKTLTFTIRKGVKFTNGTPMTPADVVFTFNMLKKYPALDLPGDWAVLSSVSQTGSDQVTMTFKAPAVPYFYYIADQTPIVPAAIWSKIANPVTYNDPHPVGTGPLHGEPVHRPEHHLHRQPALLAAGPAAASRRWSTRRSPSNNTANDQLANGQAQWGSQYIPSIKAFYTSKSPDNHYWFPPTVNVSLVPNLTNPLLANVKVRQAMSYAIDRREGLLDRRIRVRAAREPGRHRHADLLQLAQQLADQQVQLHLRPCEGQAAAGLGRLQAGLRRHHGELEGPEARPSP